MKIAQDGSARPEEVVEALGLRDLLASGAILVRTDVELGVSRHRVRPPDGAGTYRPQSRPKTTAGQARPYQGSSSRRLTARSRPNHS